MNGTELLLRSAVWFANKALCSSTEHSFFCRQISRRLLFKHNLSGTRKHFSVYCLFLYRDSFRILIFFYRQDTKPFGRNVNVSFAMRGWLKNKLSQVIFLDKLQGRI